MNSINHQFYVMRHGITMLNYTAGMQGWSDTPLLPDGERQSEEAGIGLKEIPFSAVYSSDSGRAIQTARYVLKENIATPFHEIKQDIRLREACFGFFEGRNSEFLWDKLY